MSNFAYPVILYNKDLFDEQGGQCDCACAVPYSSMKQELPNRIQSGSFLRNKSLHSVDLQVSPQVQIQFLYDDYYVCFGPFIKPVVVNRTAVDVIAFFETVRSCQSVVDEQASQRNKDLVRLTIETLIEIHLLIPAQTEHNIKEETNTLTAWIEMTSACNLNCAYCYVSHGNKRLSISTGKLIIQSLFQSASLNNYSNVKIKYAGGEPLLRFSELIELHKYASALASQYKITLSEVVLSNGTLLTAPMAKSLKDNDIKLMISLDGLDEAHVKQRAFKNGRNSSLSVLRGIEISLENNVIPDISVTVSAKNIDELPKLLDWIINRQLPFHLNFYRENDCSSNDMELRLDQNKIIAGLFAAYQIIEKILPRQSMLSSLADLADFSGPRLRACHAGKHYIAFDSSGKTTSCQMESSQIPNSLNVIDALNAPHHAYGDLQNLLVDEKEGCRDCQWKYWCAGGCPLLTFRVTGRYDIQSPNCRIYKAIYPEVIRLEGLRMLKFRREYQLL